MEKRRAKKTTPAKPAKSAKATPPKKAAKPEKAVKPAKAAKPSASAPKTKRGPDFGSSSLYLNRELTWLSFNSRVLSEAEDERNPLLERLKFLAITGSNLDEFFMKRIGGLKQQVAVGVQTKTPDGRTPKEQIAECLVQVMDQLLRQQSLVKSLTALLKAQGIEIVKVDDLSKRDKERLREDFIHNIYPLLTPQSIDPAHPFPFISNLSLNMLVTLRYPGETDHSLARVKAPSGSGSPRFLRVGNGLRFVLIEDVMAHNLDVLFPGMEVVGWSLFRVTRNANTEKSEEQAEDLMALIESELQDRKFAPIVRLQVLPGIPVVYLGRIAAELGLDEKEDAVTAEEFLGVRDFMEIAFQNVPSLRDAPHHPVDHPLLQPGRSIFHIIRDQGPILLQHPYESFNTSVERFLREAADDPKVRGIKMTLYRTAAESGIVDHLIQAAENGKQVAVVVELKARFDEEANIKLAERMEEAGIHVTYGVVGLKTHSKIILVVRQDFNGIKRYVHVGTGNYHPGTSRIYCDLGMLTQDEAIGSDATELFNYLTTGFTPKRDFKKLLVAPKLLKKGLLDRIDREIKLHKPDDPGHLFFKMNALEDMDMVRALYRASMAGVKVDLLVRDSCRLRPGIQGLSENIRIVSIVGRFLEHSRVYHFKNGGNPEVFIGSADAMKRNLENRVEVLVPVEDPLLQAEVAQVMNTLWHDRRGAWDMHSDGTYVHRRPEPKADPRSGQELLIELAEKRHRGATRLKKRRSPPAKRGGRDGA